ncbi:MAG: hypothetical protein M3150_00010 [Pseudomonadota bacterium]|nr:hypothetical protein [Pseudomonadota bacterium]
MEFFAAKVRVKLLQSKQRRPFQKKMNFSFFMDAAAYWACRAAGYALFNMAEDAALIGLMFC